MIPRDKLAHFLAGIAIAAMLAPFGFVAAMVVTMLAAVVKEMWDAIGSGKAEALDSLATMLGGAALLGWYFALGVPL